MRRVQTAKAVHAVSGTRNGMTFTECGKRINIWNAFPAPEKGFITCKTCAVRVFEKEG